VTDDEFDRFLASSLAPEDRLPDRRFVAAVQSRILVDDALEHERRRLVATLPKQLLGLVAVAGAVWTIGRAAPIAEYFERWPAGGLAMLLVAFAFVVTIFSRRSTNSVYIRTRSLLG
jgi:hypothetical protein